MNLGIEIGGTKLQLVTSNLTGHIDQRFRYTIDSGRNDNDILQRVADTIAQLTELPQNIGVGFGGPLDWQTVRIANSHQIGGWAGFQLVDWLQQQVPGAHVRIEKTPMWPRWPKPGAV